MPEGIRHCLSPLAAARQADYDRRPAHPSVAPHVVMITYQLRLYATAIRNLTAPRIQWTDATTTHFKAWPWHCDANWHVTNSRYAMFMDLGRTEWFTRAGLILPAFQTRTTFMVGASALTFRRQLDFMKPFSVETSLVTWDDRWFYVAQVFRRHDGAVAARGLIRATARRKGEVVTMGQMLAEQGVQAQAPPMTEEFQRWLESSDISVAEIRNAAA